MPWWLVPSSPTSPARSTASSTGASFWQTSWTVWSNARWRNVEYSATTGRMPAEREAGRQRDRVLLGDADVDEAVRERRLQLRQAGPGGHAGGDADDPAVVRGERDELRRRSAPCSWAPCACSAGSGSAAVAGGGSADGWHATAVRHDRRGRRRALVGVARRRRATLRRRPTRPSRPRWRRAGADPVVRVGRRARSSAAARRRGTRSGPPRRACSPSPSGSGRGR